MDKVEFAIALAVMAGVFTALLGVLTRRWLELLQDEIEANRRRAVDERNELQQEIEDLDEELADIRRDILELRRIHTDAMTELNTKIADLVSMFSVPAPAPPSNLVTIEALTGIIDTVARAINGEATNMHTEPPADPADVYDDWSEGEAVADDWSAVISPEELADMLPDGDDPFVVMETPGDDFEDV